MGDALPIVEPTLVARKQSRGLGTAAEYQPLASTVKPATLAVRESDSIEPLGGKGKLQAFHQKWSREFLHCDARSSVARDRWATENGVSSGVIRLRRRSGQHMAISISMLQTWRRSIPDPLPGDVADRRLADVLYGIGPWSISSIWLCEHLAEGVPPLQSFFLGDVLTNQVVVLGIGYGICFICTFIACFYNAIIAHAVYFVASSIALEVPWKTCNNSWNTPLCTDSLNDTLGKSGERLTTPSEEFYL
ncbi:hypothetical protein OSTOST_15443, partial [Ostertagia ostertagi]